jgi:hypothetical protein
MRLFMFLILTVGSATFASPPAPYNFASGKCNSIGVFIDYNRKQNSIAAPIGGSFSWGGSNYVSVSGPLIAESTSERVVYSLNSYTYKILLTRVYGKEAKENYWTIQITNPGQAPIGLNCQISESY